MKTQLIVSCEHGGNRVPTRYADLFHGCRRVLASHRGYDPGSLELGRTLARRLHAPLYASTTTRLLVELNRSVGHARLFSEFTAALDKSRQRQLLSQHYYPHRNRVEAAIASCTAGSEFALHLSVHTFTPQLNGQIRHADIGLLYDPLRVGEKQICHHWRRCLLEVRGDLRLRRNYPYLGKADGFTTHLRRQFTVDQYAGIELEVNQQWLRNRKSWQQLVNDITQSLAMVLAAV